MSNTKISALPEKATPSPDDLIPIVDTANPENLITKKTTLADVVSAFNGVPNGIASLNDSGKIPVEQIPALAISDTFIVNSMAEMLSLAAEVGDIAIRLDLNKSFILAQQPAAAESHWVEMLSSGIPTSNILNGGNY